MSIVRTLKLQAHNGAYTLLSQPVSTLDKYVSREIDLPSVTVNGNYQTNYHGNSYELDTDISWNQLENVGMQIGLSPDGTRHTDIGIFGNSTFYLNRQRSERDGYGLYPWVETHSPFDSNKRSVHLKVLVDKQSVEVFIDDGAQVHSDQVYFTPGDNGISFYASEGEALFSNIVIKELKTR
jgi:levanbiose-producing levanase